MAQHIGFELRSKCCYDNYDNISCGNEPIYYLLMGCLNQHTGEGAICATHANTWIEMYGERNLACKDCGLDIEAYLVFPSKDLL